MPRNWSKSRGFEYSKSSTISLCSQNLEIPWTDYLIRNFSTIHLAIVKWPKTHGFISNNQPE
ncbi:hypothetical protein CVS40_1491 [Lucilia cuprina]|nr:hypothetical protein CVS40_1491 [Lucilia cuprina]